jgi:acylphosphatase
VVIRRRVIVTGRVQGVFFRETTRREAERRGVSGFVSNRADGTVEAVFEGEPDAVDAMVELCRRGLGAAVVTGVEISEEDPSGLEDFQVR